MKTIVIALCALIAFPVIAKDVCNTSEEVIDCEGEFTRGYRESYNQRFESYRKDETKLNYSYFGAEYFTGGTNGLQCGKGSPHLTATIYGPQADDLYNQLNLPEHKEDFYPFDTYKRLNQDGTTEGQNKPHNIACQKRHSQTRCYLAVSAISGSQSVSKRFPCAFEEQAYEFSGTIVKDQAQRIVTALGVHTVVFSYTNGSHHLTCKAHPQFKMSCELKIKLSAEK